MSKLQKKPSALKREHPALQYMKFLIFFLLLWVIFALLDPDRIRIRNHAGTGPIPDMRLQDEMELLSGSSSFVGSTQI